jgi:RNA polymerase sigma factor (sigma-70 family)
MTDLTDSELLVQYAKNQSELAFSTLVERYVNLIYSTALRFTRNPHHAQEITQAVFVILSRKADTLGHQIILSGWLYQTARLTSANFVKSEIRRQNREQEAFMQSTFTESDSAAAWELIAPLLDEAMGCLGEIDRNALVMRFFENKTVLEIGQKLEIKESAAQKRVTRSLEKLRKHFLKRGVTLSAALLASAMGTNCVQAAPLGVATASSLAAHTTVNSLTVKTLVEGVIKTMVWTKTKIAVGLSAVLLLGGATGTALFQYNTGAWSSPQRLVKQSQEAYAALESYSDTGNVLVEESQAKGPVSTTNTFVTVLQRPNLYRVDTTQVGTNYTNHTVIWSQGKEHFSAKELSPGGKWEEPGHGRNMNQNFENIRAGCISTSIPETFFKQFTGDVLPIGPNFQLIKEKDEAVNGLACHVVSYTLKSPTGPKTGTGSVVLFFGKQDHLLHKMRLVNEGITITMPVWTDEQVKSILEYKHKSSTPKDILAWREQTAADYESLKTTKYVFTTTIETMSLNKKHLVAFFDR